MKLLNLQWLLVCVGLIFFTGCASVPRTQLDGAHVYRVGCRLHSTSNDLQIFIATGSKANPIVTVADNDGYPAIKDYYARAVTMRGLDGISLTIRFEEQAQGHEISFNVLQEGMTQNYKVMPFNKRIKNDL